MSRLLIIDGHAYAYRAFHAIRGMRSPAGRPTNAVYGFVKMLAKMRSHLSPSHLLVVWDGGLSQDRVGALPGYKAQRPEMPEDLEAQLDEITAYLDASGLASFCEKGVEADDYIACVTGRAVSAGVPVVIASSDKDFMQLVAPGVGLLNPNDKAERIWGAEEVRVKTGVLPGQIVDWLALVGDSVDNIPGVPGVGVKTAADLLNEFGSVEGLLARLNEVKSERVRQALAADTDLLRRNQKLVRLKDDLPCHHDLDDLVEKPANVDALRELYTRWGFRSLLAELEASNSLQAVLL